MKTIAVVNRKGGVGKSTVAAHLAGALTAAGQRVLLVDTDPQGNAGALVGIRRESGLYNFLVDNADFADVCRTVPSDAILPIGRLSAHPLIVLPGDSKTQVIPQLVRSAYALANRLDEAADHFDYIILDTAPTITMFDGSVMLAADAVVYVTECERLALEGLQSGLKELKDAAAPRRGVSLPEPRVLGIVPNKLRRGTANHAANLTMIRKAFGDLIFEPIPLLTIIGEASNYGKLVSAYAPGSEAAAAFARLFKQFTEAMGAWEKI